MTNPQYQYKCTQCGTCCRWPGYVRVSEEEIEAICREIDMEVQTFIEEYTCLTADRKSLTLVENPDSSCIFLTENNECWINAVKPKQCRDFPNNWNFPGFEKKCQAEKQKSAEPEDAE